MNAFDQAKQIVEEVEKLAAAGGSAKRELDNASRLAWEFGYFKGMMEVKLSDALYRIKELEMELKQIEEE